MRNVVEATLALMLVLTPDALAVQDAPAAEEDPRPQAAQRACLAGDLTKGMSILADLYVTTKDPVWLFNQARCLRQNGQSQQALIRFKEYLRAGDGEPEDRRQRARSQIEEIEAEIASRPPPQARPEPTPPTSVAPPSTAPPGWRRLRWAGVGTAGAGGLAVILGLVFNGQVGSIEAEVEREARSGALSGPALQRRIDDGHAAVTRRNVAYAAGAVAIAAGAAMFVIGGADAAAERVSLRPFLGPAGAGFAGSF
jgi:hypothetical protein